MRRTSTPFVAVCAVLALAGCGRKPAAQAPRGDAVSVSAADYLRPPAPQAIQRGADGLTLTGTAPAGSRIRLATPEGQAQFSDADDKGRWRIALGPLPQPRVYGLSVTHKGRQAQAQGYVLVEPGGRAALLRAGAGALRLDRPNGPGLRSLDFDREGGAVISASVTPSAPILLRVDGAQAAEGRAGPDGRAEIAVPTPMRPGAHRLQIYADGASDAVAVQVSPPEPLAQGPLRSQLTPAGLRVDWMTPGGGVQSTILIH
jgi:hypothetical protein